MYFKLAQYGKNEFWRYLILFLVVLFTTLLIGNVPLTLALVSKSANLSPEAQARFAENPADLEALGIDPIGGLAYLVFPFLVGLFTIWILMKPIHMRPFKSLITAAEKVRWNQVFFGFFIWFLFSAAFLVLILFLHPDSIQMNTSASRILLLVVVSLLLIPFQTSFEEVLFRGYFMQGFGLLFRNRLAPFLITSIGFGLLHSFNPEVEAFGFWVSMPQYILFGLIFGIVSLMSDGIELALGMHAGNNIFASIFITHSASTMQTPALFEQSEVFPWFDFTCMLVFGTLFLILAARVYKWKDWRRKLTGKI